MYFFNDQRGHKFENQKRGINGSVHRKEAEGESDLIML